MSGAHSESPAPERRVSEGRSSQRRSPQSQPVATESRVGERRVPADRRRYNKRAASDEVSPPFADVFDRIASALEGIEGILSGWPGSPAARHDDVPGPP